MNVLRIAIPGLSLSAMAFVGLLLSEGYTDTAVVPIAGDRPTVGFGSTFKEDGSPVKMGDTTTPPKAVARTLNHIQQSEAVLKKCVTGPLSQVEYDILVDFSYWRGASGACRSNVVKHINEGKYADSCAAYLQLDSRRAAGKDCSLPENKCRGVWLRAQERHRKCMDAQ